MIKALLSITLLTSVFAGASAQSVVINKVFNNTSSDWGGSVNGQGDGVELLVLEDHTDLRGAVIKDFFNMTSSSTSFDEGGQFLFSDHNLWKDLRRGTTISLIRPAISPTPAPVLDVDANDYKIQVALVNAAGSDYITQVTTSTRTFNAQGTDGIVLKKGTPEGFENVIHFFFTNYTNATLKSQIEQFTFPKLLSIPPLPGTTSPAPGFSGFAYAANPTAGTEPHKGLKDYTGLDNGLIEYFVASSGNSRRPVWGEGEPGNNEKFITYLRNSPKIESIVPTSISSNELTFRLLFSKPVTGVDPTDFDLVKTGTASGTISAITGSTDEYLITVSDLSGDGTLAIKVKEAGTQITDGTNLMFEGFAFQGQAYELGTVLPVSLISYQAKALADGTVALSWATASEKNSSYYEIERSADGINFTTIAKVNAAGSSSSFKQYRFTDTNPFTGNNYYKLIQYDSDGTPHLLGIETAAVTVQRSTASAYPNPTSETLTLKPDGLPFGDISVKISSISGQVILNKNYNWDGGAINLNLSNFAPGQYVLTIGSKENLSRQTIVKL